MKTVIIFIGLKLAEIAGVVVVVYGTYWIGKGMKSLVSNFFPHIYADGWSLLVVTGIMCIWLIVVLVLIAYGLYLLIRANWRKAKELSKKW